MVQALKPATKVDDWKILSVVSELEENQLLMEGYQVALERLVFSDGC